MDSYVIRRKVTWHYFVQFFSSYITFLAQHLFKRFWANAMTRLGANFRMASQFWTVFALKYGHAMEMLQCIIKCMYFVYLLMKFFYYLEHPLSCILRPKKLFHFEYFFVNVRSGFFLLRRAFVLPRREWNSNEWRLSRSLNWPKSSRTNLRVFQRHTNIYGHWLTTE